MNYEDVATIMNATPTSTEITVSSIHEAYSQAESFTELGFEVTAPQSMDGGSTYTITVSR